ncbi:alpha/beta hydrolase [Rhodococcus tibetensis]|uniref:Alpha/beta hydrolase n=1 Tax=Rhodococcus tibetensis TaxID=2965064 RepID=A0ABT1QJ79_9NOCA|nr:alpha/beta hydrolase [Rhodococcus sp. FXJ9.536]MCQ4122328.1 alpha/beta hydrolase [Rhodococcus sp. FXJ9.536]
MNNIDLREFVREMRENYLSLIPSAGSPDPVADVRVIAVPASTTPQREVSVRAYQPLAAGSGPHPIMVFVHGGGFSAGDLDTHDVLCRALANGAGVIVLSVDWRLAPEHQFPAGIDDVYEVLTWAHRHGESIGGDTSRLVICGDSAGGNLAAGIAILARDRNGPTIAAQLLFYPTVSNKMDTPSWAEFGDTNFPTRTVMTNVIAAYVPDDVGVFDPRVAPLWANLENLPPALVQVGEHDPLRDECLAYGAALTRAGGTAEVKVYSGAEHGFIQFFKDTSTHPEGKRGVDDATKFLRDVLA